MVTSPELQEKLQKERLEMGLEERQVMALEMIADQLALIDNRLLQIQTQGRNPLRG